jgi:hypothetical protein
VNYKSGGTDEEDALCFNQETVYEIQIFRDFMKSTSKVIQAPLVNAVEHISLATLLFN